MLFQPGSEFCDAIQVSGGKHQAQGRVVLYQGLVSVNDEHHFIDAGKGCGNQRDGVDSMAVRAFKMGVDPSLVVQGGKTCRP